MPKKQKLGALYFTDIAIIRKDEVVLTGNYYALEDDGEERIALLSLKKGVWGGLDLSGIAHAVRFAGTLRSSKRKYFILERNRGLYQIIPPSTVKFNLINNDREGFLMDLRLIDGKWYSVGGYQQIYQLNESQWSAFDEGVYVPGENGIAKLLLSIDGNSESDIYTVGFNGVIFHFNGSIWQNLDSPTNVGLQRVLCVSKDEVYVCGYNSALYRGNTKGWKALTEQDSDIVFWDMSYFKGKVYVCTSNSLFIINNNQLEEVEILVKGPLNFYRLTSDNNELWACGNECVLKFDGEKWQNYIFPDNM